MKYIIQGLTTSGAVFRPSDWNERLCSAFAHFRPTAKLRSVDEARNHKMQGYSTYIMPTFVNGVRSVIVDTQLGDIEPMALEFVLNFARDNDLVIEEYIANQVLKFAEAA